MAALSPPRLVEVSGEVARGGQFDREGRARADAGRRHPDAAVHAPHELAADVEAEPGAADAAVHIRVEAIELVEDPALLGDRDAKPLVVHREANLSPDGRDRDGDRSAVGGVLDGVVDEVDQHPPDLVRVACHLGQIRVGDQRELVRAAEVRALRLNDIVDERDRVAVLDRDVQRVGIEPRGPEDVVDRPRKPVGLPRNDIEQVRALVVGERDVLAAERHRCAVDRSERRPQLVRHGRDELGAHRLERTLLGQVAEGVDDPVRHDDPMDREPELTAAEVEWQRLRPRRDPSLGGKRHRATTAAQPGIASTATRSITAASASPVAAAAARFQVRTRPWRSTRKTPSPTEASTRTACARSSAARYSWALSTATATRAASSRTVSTSLWSNRVVVRIRASTPSV